jgi:hydrogenase-4 component B
MSLPIVCLLLSTAVCAASGLLALGFPRWPGLADRLSAGLLVLGAVLGLGAAALALGAPSVPLFEHPWGLPAGRFALAIDPLSASFLFPVLVVPALAACYGLGYWPAATKPASAARIRVFLGLLTAAMAVLVVARDAVLFLVAFEVMTLSAFFLVTAEDERGEARRAGWLYLAAAHVSLVFLLACFALLHELGGSYELCPVPAERIGWGGRTAILALGLVGFGIKAGIVPLHVWLPGAHAAAPSHVSAVLSGVVIKTGIYGLLRLTALLPEPTLLPGLAVFLLGAASGVAGVAFALGQHDLKRLLAYHSIENIGIIVMGLGLALLGRWAQRADLVALGFACALMHVWNHALFKSLLFLSAGSVVHALGTRELERMGGLWRSMPWSGALFLLGAIAICGLPPLNGFVSEFYLYSGALRSLGARPVTLGALAAPVLALIGALACACFAKVFGTVFLGHPREHARTGHECPWSMRLPMLSLAAACLVLGLAPVLATPLLESAIGVWAGSAAALPPGLELSLARVSALLLAALALACLLVLALRRRAGRGALVAVPTWDCGFAASAERAQYTGSSLARTLVNLFAFLLRPVTRQVRPGGFFPGPASYAGQVDDPILERLAYPLSSGLAQRFARLRRYQTGRIQGYVLYVLGATLVLLVVVLPALELLKRLLLR